MHSQTSLCYVHKQILINHAITALLRKKKFPDTTKQRSIKESSHSKHKTDLPLWKLISSSTHKWYGISSMCIICTVHVYTKSIIRNSGWAWIWAEFVATSKICVTTSRKSRIEGIGGGATERAWGEHHNNLVVIHYLATVCVNPQTAWATYSSP